MIYISKKKESHHTFMYDGYNYLEKNLFLNDDIASI